MYNIGPLDSLRRMFSRLSGQANYWFRRISYYLPGRGSRMPDISNLTNNEEFKGTPVLLIAAVSGCLLSCCCLIVLVIGIVVYLLPALR